jgi:hypothetical protein
VCQKAIDATTARRGQQRMGSTQRLKIQQIVANLMRSASVHPEASPVMDEYLFILLLHLPS